MNKRQANLLKTLYNNRGFSTLSELAEKFQVSVKTIRNDITVIREYLEINIQVRWNPNRILV